MGPRVEDLRAWFDTLDEGQRICRVWVRDEIHAGACGRAAVGIDRLGGRNALVCEAHKPAGEQFVRLRDERA